MRIGVISDTHDRHEVVADAVRLLGEQKVELVLHCGDIETPETVALFKPLPTHFVFGNWDKEKGKLVAAIREIGGQAHDAFGAMELAGKRIAWCHSHDRHQFHELEHCNYFDYLFYGHTHVREQHRTGKTLVANPGALFRANPKTCVVLDIVSGEFKPIIIPTAAKPGESILSMPGLANRSMPPMPGLSDAEPTTNPGSD